MGITDFVIWVFGILPLWILIVVGAWWGLSRLIQQVGVRDLSNLVAVLVLVSLVVVTVMFAICYTCRNIMPTEAFAANSDLSALSKELMATEKDICELVTRADKYVESKMGKEGQDNPAALAERIKRLHADAGAGGVLICGGVTPSEITVKYIAGRISLMEQTLMRFTLPVFQDSYKAVFACEIEAGAATPDITIPSINPQLDTLPERLSRVQEFARQQRTRLLDVMDRKEADTRAGRVSECDMKRGSDAAVDSSNQMSMMGGNDLKEAFCL